MPLRSPLARLLLIVVVVGLASPFLAVPAFRWTLNMQPVSRAQNTNGNDNSDGTFGASKKMVQRADRAAGLEAYAHDPGGSIIPRELRMRADLLTGRKRLQDAGDVRGVARLSSVLSSEAFERAARVTARWLDRRDQPTGLFPHTLHPKDRYFSYGDVGADLYPFLAIGTHQLLPARYGEILGTLAAERQLKPGLPHDVMLDGLRLRERKPEEQMLADVEYVKDGLLPLTEQLGPEPWRPRMVEVLDSVIGAASVPTPAGPVVSDACEVNGSLLQALARLSWTDDNQRYTEMARRIAAACRAASG
jgi:hypothetical protein